MSGPTPGSREWLRYMTASKIAAVVGTSPYESRFSLWHRMHGDIGPQEQSDEMTYGLVMEPAITRWFGSQHPNRALDPGRPFWIEWDGPEPWAATPDGLVVEPGGARVPLEVKTARDSWEWGDSGTEGPIPPGYYDQVQWQIAIMGATHGYVAADVMMSLRWYRIPADPARIAVLTGAATEFMASLAAHEPPPLDGSTHTYIATRDLHPDIDDEKYELDDHQAHAWITACREHEQSEQAWNLARSTLNTLIAPARRATWRDHNLATRQARGSGTPYIVAGRNLPVLEGATL